MLKNYLKIAARNMLRHKSYSIISVVGLAVGMACALFILLFVRHELSYDHFHKNSDRLYRLVTDKVSANGIVHFSGTSFPMGKALQDEIPEVQKFVRFKALDSHLMQHGEHNFYEDRIFCTDSTFLGTLGFSLAIGNPKTALFDPQSVVITHEIAQKYFGDENPLNKTLTVDGVSDLKITGVLKPITHPTHLRFDFLVPFSIYRPPTGYDLNDWGWMTFHNYILLADGVSPQSVEEKLPNFIKNHFTATTAQDRRLFLQPITDVYFDQVRGNELGPTSSLLYSQILSIIAALLLLIAVFNYMNLATAHSVKRGREVGIRKVLGSHRRQLVTQFLGEALLLTVFALLIAFALFELFRAPIANAFGVDFSSRFVDFSFIALLMFSIAAVVGILSGSYPAFVLSAFQPIHTLKGNFEGFQSGALMRKILVVTQFAISILLITGTLFIFEQLNYVRTRDLGFNKDQIIVIHLRSDELRREFLNLKNVLSQNQHVARVGAALNGLDGRYGSYPVYPEGKNQEQPLQLSIYPVHYDFFETLGMQFKFGRSFSERFPSDATEGIIVNETAAALLGWPNAVGKHLRIGGSGARRNAGGPFDGVIVGVVKDFYFESLHTTIQPLALYFGDHANEFVFVRLKANHLKDALASLENHWQRVVPNYPFEFTFLDQRMDAIYHADKVFARLIGLFSIIAIIIACIGLFGLAIFTVEQRTKEIGMRKVLGASLANIALVLTHEFFRLVLIAFFLALPVSYFAARQWLQNFAYRIEISWWVFALAGGLALGIALLTVSTQAVRAALANPVESLRYE